MSESIEASTLALVEGYSTIGDDGSERLRRLTSELADRMDDGAASRAYSAALATGSLEQILEAALRLANENRTVEVHNTVMNDLRARLGAVGREGRRAFAAAAITPALVFLGSRLDELMERVRGIGRIGALSAEEAIAEGRVDEWRTASALCDEYGEIRRVQRHLTLTLVTRDEAPDAAAMSMSGYLRDALDTEHVWHRIRAQASSQRTAIPEDEEHGAWLGALPPLPWRREQAGTFPDADRFGYLLWMANNARPFVPTIPELIDAHKRNVLIVQRPADITRLTEVLTALDDYRGMVK